MEADAQSRYRYARLGTRAAEVVVVQRLFYEYLLLHIETIAWQVLSIRSRIILMNKTARILKIDALEEIDALR